MQRNARSKQRIVSISFAAVLALAAIQPASLTAQGLISVGAGAGGGFGDRNKDGSGSGLNGLAFVQLHPPLIPVALRADAVITKSSNSSTALALVGNAVIIAPIPFVQPYALLGYGHYGVGKDGAISGWSLGAGVRARVPNVILFAEVRRHQRISRDLLTIGISR